MSDLPPTPEEIEQVLALGCDTIVHPFCPESCAKGAFIVFKGMIITH